VRPTGIAAHGTNAGGALTDGAPVAGVERGRRKKHGRIGGNTPGKETVKEAHRRRLVARGGGGRGRADDSDPSSNGRRGSRCTGH
jgi:hypothetical protein